MKNPKHTRKTGMSMIEVTVAMAITAVSCAGLYTMGMSVRRSGERLRIATEAQSYAKEALEEIVSVGAENMAMPDCNVGLSGAATASTGATINRGVELIWHAADGTPSTNRVEGGYAEVHVNVSYPAPRSGKTLIDTYSTLIN